MATDAFYKLKKGLRSPQRIPRYLMRRWRDLRHGYITFDVGSVTGDQTAPPVFSYDLYLEVSAFQRAVSEGQDHFSTGLEIGAGYGRLTPWIQDHVEELHAVEPSDGLLETARRFHGGVTFRNALVQDLPYPDGMFDLVVSWTVLMHVPPADFEAAVAEIERVLAADGTVILSEAVEGGAGVSRAFSRSVSDWEAAFAERDLVWTDTRPTDHRDVGANETQVVMRFE